jgi:ABC-type multidrug transport system fused ATPase/permease subunit
MLFIAAITQFKELGSSKYINYLFKYTGPIKNPQIILLFGGCLIFLYIFRCLATFAHTYFIQSFTENRKNSLTFQFFQNYLRFNYQEFTAKNPATIGKLVFADATNLMTIVASGIKMFSEIFTVILIYASLVIINWKMTLILSFVLCTKVVFLLKTFSKKLSLQGAKLAKHTRNISKIYTESFRNFKLVKLLGHENYILSRFNKENRGLVKVQIINRVLLETPRLFLETIGFTILVSAVIYVVYRVQTPEYVIPILSMYALAFYRFMPSTTRIMQAYNELIFARGTIDFSKNLMYKSGSLGNQKISFSNKIDLQNVTFGYQKNKNILANISLKINKTERIAFIGESGAGKSSLADLIMGFYLPEQGEIFIDNQKLTRENIKSWRSKIGYIPQQIYLFDGTVAENVVFGRKYDKKLAIRALQKANVYDFLLKENGLETKVGEGGIRLSGGQMQRIAIARALYSDPQILVLDEATSALDNETETKIMNEIYNLHNDKTLIIIAHRLSTVLKCEKIYEIKSQSLTQVNKNIIYQIYKENHDQTRQTIR